MARERGEPAEAIELYECWLALNGDSTQTFAAYFNLAALLGAAGKPLQAIHAYRECVRIKPDFLQARLNLGRALENVSRPLEAYQEWRAGFNSLPQVYGEAIGNKCLLLIQGARLLEHHVDDAGTEKLLEQVMDIDPHCFEATRQWIGHPHPPLPLARDRRFPSRLGEREAGDNLAAVASYALRRPDVPTLPRLYACARRICAPKPGGDEGCQGGARQRPTQTAP